MGKHYNKYESQITTFVPEATLDYHERGALFAYDIEKLFTDFIEDSYHAGYRQVLIISGKGAVVRPLVEKLLPRNRYVAQFKYAGYFNGQNGAFEVTLQS